MLFKDFKNLFQHTWFRELWDFSDLEIRLIKVQWDTVMRISELLKLEHINNCQLVWNYVNIDFSNFYLKELFLNLNIDIELEDKSALIHYFSPNPWQNIHLWVLRNILLWGFISNIYRKKYKNIQTETMICDSWEVFETMVSLYNWENLCHNDIFWENPLFEYENRAKNIIKKKKKGLK